MQEMDYEIGGVKSGCFPLGGYTGDKGGYSGDIGI